MRRALIAGAIGTALVAAVVVATAPSWASHGSMHARSHDHDKARAAHISASLTDRRVLAHYGLGAGRLVSSDVCVHDVCVHRTYGPDPTCAPAPATCIGTSLFVRRLPSGITISVEMAAV